MLVSLTALYAAILAILTTALAINVSAHRAKLNIQIGDADNPQMLRMIRLHGNAVEYVPIALILMLTYEINGGVHIALHIAGIAMVAGRLFHPWGMWQSPVPNFGRFVGQSLTWLTIVALAVLNIVKVV